MNNSNERIYHDDSRSSTFFKRKREESYHEDDSRRFDYDEPFYYKKATSDNNRESFYYRPSESTRKKSFTIDGAGHKETILVGDSIANNRIKLVAARRKTDSIYERNHKPNTVSYQSGNTKTETTLRSSIISPRRKERSNVTDYYYRPNIVTIKTQKNEDYRSPEPADTKLTNNTMRLAAARREAELNKRQRQSDVIQSIEVVNKDLNKADHSTLILSPDVETENQELNEQTEDLNYFPITHESRQNIQIEDDEVLQVDASAERQSTSDLQNLFDWSGFNYILQRKICC